MRPLALIALGATAHGERSATTTLHFTAHAQPANSLAWEQIGDVVIVDALAFDHAYHRAFVVDGGETITVTADGLVLSYPETELANK